MGLDNGYGLGIGSLKPGVCTSSTRPASPFEGQLVYETDTDMLAIWNGSAWRRLAAATKTGSVLQVVTATTTTGANSSSTTYIDSTLSVTITPSSSTSKIFIMVNQSTYMDASTAGPGVRLVRGSTTLQTTDSNVYSTGGAIVGAVVFMYLDSPATTSATTYKTQISRASGTGTVYAQVNGNPSNITAFEIAS